MTAPGVFAWIRAPALFNGVEMNVTDQLQKVRVMIDEDGFVAASKQRSISVMRPVESLRVKPVDVTHDSRQISLGSSQEKVIVIFHEAKSEDPDGPTFVSVFNQPQKLPVVTLLFENVAPF